MANELLSSRIEMPVLHRFAVVAVSLAFAACGGAMVQRPGVTVYESKTEASITEGDTSIDCDPDAAFHASADYQQWPRIFSDIRTALVTSRQGDDALVTFVHTDGNRDNLHFHNRPETHTLWFEDTGDAHAKVWAEISFLPGPRAGTTRVHSRLYAVVTGVASVFVSGGYLRHMREQRIQHELLQLRAYFSPTLARAH